MGHRGVMQARTAHLADGVHGQLRGAHVDGTAPQAGGQNGPCAPLTSQRHTIAVPTPTANCWRKPKTSCTKNDIAFATISHLQ